MSRGATPTRPSTCFAHRPQHVGPDVELSANLAQPHPGRAPLPRSAHGFPFELGAEAQALAIRFLPLNTSALNIRAVEMSIKPGQIHLTSSSSASVVLLDRWCPRRVEIFAGIRAVTAVAPPVFS